MQVLFGGIMDEIIRGGISGGVAGTVGGGLAVLLVGLLIPRKKCPDCQTLRPRFRRAANRCQPMSGRWTCAQCGCEVDRKGRKIKNDRKADD
ncbi:MAG TPA: hypothetical protein DDY78_22395 [Planctomycetales bacterium]|nr:hypothetical protein [Planctomycetales bacterium]